MRKKDDFGPRVVESGSIRVGTIAEAEAFPAEGQPSHPLEWPVPGGAVTDGNPAGVKSTEGKAPVYQGFLALFPRAIAAVARVSVYGAEKHRVPLSAVDFTNRPDAELNYLDAEVRHMLDEVIQGRYNGSDGGQLHAAQRAWDAMASLESMLRDHEDSGAVNLRGRPGGEV